MYKNMLAWHGASWGERRSAFERQPAIRLIWHDLGAQRDG